MIRIIAGAAFLILVLIGCMQAVDEEELIQGENLSIIEENDSEETVDLKLNADIQDTIVVNKKYYSDVGEEISGRVAGFDFMLKVIDISEDDLVDIRINSKRHADVRVGRFIELADGLVLNIEDTLYNDPAEKGKSILFYSFEKREVEHYPSILIEEDIGGFYYDISGFDRSRQIVGEQTFMANEYSARYDGAAVRVTTARDEVLEDYFEKRYTDRDRITKYGLLRYIYQTGRYTAWLSDNAIVVVEGKDIQPLIDEYHAKYPSILKEDYLCEIRFTIEEGSSEEISGHEILNYAVSDGNMKVKLKIDGEFIDALEIGDYFMLDDKRIALDDMTILSDGNKDFAEFCMGE